MKAPLDVKRAIWEHEKDELIFDKRMGSAHLTDEQMAEATAEANLLPGVRAALMAWMYLATTRPWIEALTVNHITERKNNPAIVKGGGFTARFAHKRVADQGGTIEGLDINTKVHMVADEDHSDMFEPIYDRHITDERTAQAVIRAALDSLAVDRAYRSALASAWRGSRSRRRRSARVARRSRFKGSRFKVSEASVPLRVLMALSSLTSSPLTGED